MTEFKIECYRFVNACKLHWDVEVTNDVGTVFLFNMPSNEAYKALLANTNDAHALTLIAQAMTELKADEARAFEIASQDIATVQIANMKAKTND